MYSPLKFPVSKYLRQKLKPNGINNPRSLFRGSFSHQNSSTMGSNAMWLLAFNCRGMYWADFTTMSVANVKDNDLYNTWCAIQSMYLRPLIDIKPRRQNDQMKIRIDQYPTLQLFRLAKLSFAKRCIENKTRNCSIYK